jgi:hypothetical protein
MWNVAYYIDLIANGRDLNVAILRTKAKKNVAHNIASIH